MVRQQDQLRLDGVRVARLRQDKERTDKGLCSTAAHVYFTRVCEVNTHTLSAPPTFVKRDALEQVIGSREEALQATEEQDSTGHAGGVHAAHVGGLRPRAAGVTAHGDGERRVERVRLPAWAPREIREVGNRAVSESRKHNKLKI